MAFTLDREEASRRLGVSTRTIDRHIQADRIRTKRIGKKIFLEEDDVETLRAEDKARSDDGYVVILSDNEEDTTKSTSITEPSSQAVVSHAEISSVLTEFSRIYDDAQAVITKKDEAIKDLSYRLGKAETELEKSIDVNEYKKVAYMMEHLKTEHQTSKEAFSKQVQKLEKEVQKRNSALIGITILFVLVISSSLIFLFWDRLV